MKQKIKNVCLKKNKMPIINIMDMKKENDGYEKILRMPFRSKISDAEINSLFLGLCRIVKNQAAEEAKFLQRKEVEKNFSLCQEVNKKNKEIEMLRMINFQLKKKIDNLIAKNALILNEKNSVKE